MERGIKRGMKRGMERINMLNSLLVRDGRIEELIKAAEDLEQQQALMESYGI